MVEVLAGGLPCGTTAVDISALRADGGRPKGTTGGVPGIGKPGIDLANASAISSADTPPLANES